MSEQGEHPPAEPSGDPLSTPAGTLQEPTGASAREPGRRPPPVAPVWHTVLLVGILLAIAAYGAYSNAQSEPVAPGERPERRGSAIPTYISVAIAEWALLRFVHVGLRRRGHSIRDLIGARWTGPEELGRDIGIAVMVWAGWSAIEAVVGVALGPDTANRVSAILPRSPAEIAVWVFLAATAGFCEELIFRGYVQRQAEAWVGGTGAVAAQAILFGVSHGYQGLRSAITITIFGVVFGVLARACRSLRPGMILHTWTDLVSGIVGGRAS